jgi:uncharacterized membrane protein
MENDKKRIIFLVPFRGIGSIILHVFLGIFIAILATSYFAEIFAYILPLYLSYALGLDLAFLSLALSPINLVVKRVENEVLSIQQDVVYFFGIPIVVPRRFSERTYTYIALNAGGALLPIATTIFLLVFLHHPLSISLVLLETLVVIAVSKYFARVIPGVGVVMPPIIPSIVSSAVSYVLFISIHPILVPLSAYISSVLGTLIGADVLNVNKMLREARPQMISIGGMGTFDGIFISGLLSLAIGTFLISL